MFVFLFKGGHTKLELKLSWEELRLMLNQYESGKQQQAHVVVSTCRQARDVDNLISTSYQRCFTNVVSTSINQRCINGGFTNVYSSSTNQRFHVESTLIL